MRTCGANSVGHETWHRHNRLHGAALLPPSKRKSRSRLDRSKGDQTATVGLDIFSHARAFLAGTSRESD